MKTKLLLLALFSIVSSELLNAQNRTTLYATNDEISDNLDLRAVASIFGESSSLQDFERRLNDPRFQLSNLDLNYDNQVDYLRVIESVEQRTHVVIIQAVLGRDRFQDVATIDVEKNRNNSISIQVVGDVFMYGDNYIYEPVYEQTPAIYASFYLSNYRPYYSNWNWNYYPNYYVAWRPFPVYRYKRNINYCINSHNSYRYVNYRNSYRAPIICASNRQNFYANSHPHYSFSKRNKQVANRYELDTRRGFENEKNYNKKDSQSNSKGDGNRGYNSDYKKAVVYDRSTSDSRRNYNYANKDSAPMKVRSQSGNDYASSNTNEKHTRKEPNRETIATRSNENRGDAAKSNKARSENSVEGNRNSGSGNRRI